MHFQAQGALSVPIYQETERHGPQHKPPHLLPPTWQAFLPTPPLLWVPRVSGLHMPPPQAISTTQHMFPIPPKVGQA